MQSYQTGIEGLLADHQDLLEGRRVGLICHPASVTADGIPSAKVLRQAIGPGLTALLGPEHGVLGVAGPGEAVSNQRHPDWDIPIFSLYGDEQRTFAELGQYVDTLVYDLQDISVRCYTYLHTLRQMMRMSAQSGWRFIVTDRPSPLATCLDGPMLNPAFQSIVAPAPVPLIYGFTPGETARWLVGTGTNDRTSLSPLSPLGTGAFGVIPVKGYLRDAFAWPRWVPPSPAIRSVDCALAFPITVFSEALPQFDVARQSDLAFRVLRAEGLQAAAVLGRLQGTERSGVQLEADGEELRIAVENVHLYRPAAVAVHLLAAIGEVQGGDWLWRGTGARPEWFDKLMGTDQVRLQLQSGTGAEEIIQGWQMDLARFGAERQQFLLYPGGTVIRG